jgi:hypothetical protein
MTRLGKERGRNGDVSEVTRSDIRDIHHGDCLVLACWWLVLSEMLVLSEAWSVLYFDRFQMSG